MKKALAVYAEAEEQTHVELSYGDAINEATKEEMERDKNVIIIAEDIAVSASSGIFGAVDEKRVRSTPISENSFAGMAIGAAMTGLRPIVNLNIANFIHLASDQIINQASKLHFMTGGQMKLPVVFRALMLHNGANAAQHSDRPYSMFMNTPGLKILVPSTPADMKGLLKSAIRDDDPVLIFEDVNLYADTGLVSTDPDYLIPIGKADIKKEGDDITVVSISGCLRPSLAAAEELEEKNGISVEVIDLRTLVPLDKDTILESVKKTGRLIIVDLAHRTNGAAAEIAATIAEEAFDILRRPIQRVTTPDINIPFSPVLEKLLYPNKEDVMAAIEKIL